MGQSHSVKTCEHCEKSVLNGLYLKKQLIFDHGIIDRVFICDIFPKTMFLVEVAYKKHVKEQYNHLEG